MNETSTTVRAEIDLTLEPAEAFSIFVEELATVIARAGITFEQGVNGRMTEGEHEVGRVVSWQPGKGILLQWRPADWDDDETTEVAFRFEKAGGRTRETLEHRDWGRQLGDSGELAGWFAGEVAAPLLRATAPSAFGDWLTDRQARRPSGAQAHAVYPGTLWVPLYHYPNFRVILAELALAAEDYLLEVGCGGGAFLHEALQSGCRAAAIDHSPDMVQLAQEVNRDAMAAGRLEVRRASADQLPFSDATFTCAAMTGVLGFLPDPVAAFTEMRRVLRDGGRIVVMGSDLELKGTPAAPEPMASRLRFSREDELAQLAVDAGFDEVRVMRRDLEPFARAAGIPEEHLSLFAGAGAQFLLAGKG